MKYWIKLDRISAWVLLFGMTLYFVSGYGMTKGIIDSTFATKIHLDALSIVVVIAFVAHTGFATRLAFIRWKIWNWPVRLIWVAFFLSFLLGFVYLDQIYQPSDSKTAESQDANSTASSEIESIVAENKTEAQDPLEVSSDSGNTSSSADTSASTQKVFTSSTLAKYDGLGGNPAYLAVDGKVYDLSTVFKNGSHFSHYAGRELTNAFYSYHASRAFAKYPVVGTYQP